MDWLKVENQTSHKTSEYWISGVLEYCFFHILQSKIRVSKFKHSFPASHKESMKIVFAMPLTFHPVKYLVVVDI